MGYLAKKLDSWAAKRTPIGKNIQLNSKQVFVLPTKSGFAFILVMFVILLVGINYQNNLAYGLSFILSSVFFITIIHTCYNLSGIRVTNVGAEPTFVDGPVNCRIRLESIKAKTKQSIAIGWDDSFEEQGLEKLQWIDVDKLSGAELLLTKRASKRGFFYPGKIYIETQFPLGLFVTWVKIDLLFKVVIYPKPIEGKISTVGLAGENDEGVHGYGRGVDDFQGLRSYQPGDSMRLVNWKSFSKGQGVFVKDFSALAGKEPWLDFDQVEGSVEQRLSVLCFWVLQMEEALQPYGVRLPNYELSPAIGDRQRKEALKALAMHGVFK